MMMMVHSGLLSPFARLQAMHSTFSWSVPCESSGCFRSIITWFQLNLKFTKQKSKKKRSLVFGTSHANRLRKYQGNKLLAFVIFFHFFLLLEIQLIAFVISFLYSMMQANSANDVYATKYTVHSGFVRLRLRLCCFTSSRVDKLRFVL